jgi:hypothetical protein
MARESDGHALSFSHDYIHETMLLLLARRLAFSSAPWKKAEKSATGQEGAGLGVLYEGVEGRGE